MRARVVLLETEMSCLIPVPVDEKSTPLPVDQKSMTDYSPEVITALRQLVSELRTRDEAGTMRWTTERRRVDSGAVMCGLFLKMIKQRGVMPYVPDEILDHTADLLHQMTQPTLFDMGDGTTVEVTHRSIKYQFISQMRNKHRYKPRKLRRR